MQERKNNQEKGKVVKRDCFSKFRCTLEERQKIEKAAKEEKMTISEYMRMKVLKSENPRIPTEVMELLNDLKYQNAKIGTNVNQVARFCNSKQTAHFGDYQLLIKHLKKLEWEYQRVYRLLMGWFNGNNKIT